MKRIVGLSMAILLAAVLMYAQDKGAEMVGMICYAKCIKQTVDSGKDFCNPDCKAEDKTGDAVFVDEYGKTMKIANQKMVMPYVGKKVKMHAKMMKDKHMMMVVDISEYGSG